jgi:hypothetical protein
MNLIEMRTRITRMLMDSGEEIWPGDVLDEALRQALSSYSTVAPCTREITVSIPAAGDIDLSAVNGLLDVIEARWPYQAGKAEALQPVNRITGWRCWRDLDKPTLELRTAAGTSPAGGEDLHLRYTTLHTLDGLDEAGFTSIPLVHFSLLVRGAAGYAALFRAIDKVEKRSYGTRRTEPSLLQNWGNAVLERFHHELEELRQRNMPVRGAARWRMDKWDSP